MNKKFFFACALILAYFGCSLNDSEKGEPPCSFCGYGDMYSSSSGSTPNPPYNVIATANSESSITINWPSVSNASDYGIYRSTTVAGSYTLIGFSTTTSYTDNSLSSGTTYYYKVTAYNSYGEGTQSNHASATTLPNAPTGVTATSNSTNSINVNWEFVTGATGYYIYRSTTASGTYTKVDSSTTISYTNIGLSAYTTYCYKVAAYNSSGAGIQSSYVSATTLPDAPAGVFAMASGTSITVDWESVTGATGYYIYSSTTAGGIYSQIGISTTTSYTNTSLSPSTIYYYKVAAYNNGGAGTQSSYVSATTLVASCPNPVISNGFVTCDGQTYRTVNINGQVWFAENLNYEVSGSKCYNNNSANCVAYGRLYNWSMAMNFPSSCDSINCSNLIKPKHRGICPEGWHIPSEVEWNALSSYVQSNSGCSNCDAAKLKATSGWSSCGPSGSGSSYLCEDAYGFSALPGGTGLSGGSFNGVGTYSIWWSASEYGSNYVYYRIMSYNYESTDWNSNVKDGFFSVRCLQD